MEKYISATEANQRFSEMLREVSNGESFPVTSRGKVVAHVTPPKQRQKTKTTKEYLASLEGRPPLTTGPWKREDLYDRSDRHIP